MASAAATVSAMTEAGRTKVLVWPDLHSENRQQLVAEDSPEVLIKQRETQVVASGALIVGCREQPAAGRRRQSCLSSVRLSHGVCCAGAALSLVDCRPLYREPPTAGRRIFAPGQAVCAVAETTPVPPANKELNYSSNI